ncbi:hypothetical protein GQ53DRAFT_877399 [Thozetella sp. PMI_491]|nr:hypothetical protein GQ53DRAFT_877399 [Thozetella sp. PMI_491]
MASSYNYTLREILASASIHPFYNSDIEYPPDSRAISAAKENTTGDLVLSKQPLLWKEDLYETVARLVDDTSPQNIYRHSAYASTTGGGTPRKPLFFATDVHENRRQRADFGQLIRKTGIVSSRDWVLTTHECGDLYRALDLILEIFENAGASVLSAGNFLEPIDVIRILSDYHVNVLTGGSSQIVNIVRHISKLSSNEAAKVKIDKIIYTSEMLTSAQRNEIFSVLGPVKICSIIGSAEAGPYAVSNPDLTGEDPAAVYQDFVFDTRANLIEIIPASSTYGSEPVTLCEGEKGSIVLTSLARLRNPLVRYITGDIGSVHPLPQSARFLIPEVDWPFLRVLRLYGRDRRFSFEWDGDYLEFHGLQSLMNNPEYGVLEWQVLLDKMESSSESLLEVRLLFSSGTTDSQKNALVGLIKRFVHVFSGNQHRFRLVCVESLDAFEVSRTGRKVIKFLDRFPTQ